MEQGYKQLKQELGWADFMVRSDQAIRRHWHLVCCAFSFCWRVWFATGPPTDDRVPPDSTGPAASHDPATAPVTGRGGNGRGPLPSSHAHVSWPRTLRHVRSWLDPWTFLWRCWRAWSNAPPPPELRALLDAVGQGHPLDLYLRS